MSELDSVDDLRKRWLDKLPRMIAAVKSSIAGSPKQYGVPFKSGPLPSKGMPSPVDTITHYRDRHIRALLLSLGLSGIVLLQACVQPPLPSKIAMVCPPEPPIGSGYACAPVPPSPPCRIDPAILAIDKSSVGALLSVKWRSFIAHEALAIEDLCQ